MPPSRGLLLPLLLSPILVAARTVTPLNGGWRFSLTEQDAPTNDDCLAPSTPSSSACAPVLPSFDDSAWRVLSIPHDFLIEQPFSPDADKNTGFKAGAKGWYRLQLSALAFNEEERVRANQTRLWVEFDGVMSNASVFLNGHRLGKHRSGYTSFRYALDPAFLNFDGTGHEVMSAEEGMEEDKEKVENKEIKRGLQNDRNGKNVLAVHVDATTPDGWWYDGGGIYRKVRLVSVDSLHVTPMGVYLPATVNEGSIRHRQQQQQQQQEDGEDDLVGDAVVNVQTTVVNEGTAARTFRVHVSVTGSTGAAAAAETKGESVVVTLEGGKEEMVLVPVDLPGVGLWSLGHPNLLEVRVQLREVEGGREEGVVIDEVVKTTGVRTLEFDPVKGFFLNGKQTKLYGMCNHQDYAGVGVAVPDSLQGYRVEMMKKMGANAWRTAHNPPTEQLLVECDRRGMLVWDENHRNKAEDEEWREDLRMLVKRDRNHPSVIVWSLCNELLCEDFDEKAANTLMAEVEKLDPVAEGGRLVSSAVNDKFEKEFPHLLGLMGFNYNINQYKSWHEQNPGQPLVGSETSSAVSDRGVYAKDEEGGYVSAYDVNFPPWGASAEDGWCPIAANEYMAGSFVWTGFDYRGEPTPYAWPNINSHFGILDTCGFPKDLFYYYQSVWLELPSASGNSTPSLLPPSLASRRNRMVHLVPSHWNWGGEEGGEGGREGVKCAGRCRLLRGGGRKGGKERDGEKEIEVWAFSNGEAVELFLNGKSLGRREMPVEEGGREGGVRCRHVVWKVLYEPGVLEAKAYGREGGREEEVEWAVDRVVTTGPAAALRLVVDWPLRGEGGRAGGREGGCVLGANGEDVAVVDVQVVDAQGQLVPTVSGVMVNFTLTSSLGGMGRGGEGGGGRGGGKILGVGNGDPSCHESDTFLHLPGGERTASRSVFNGHARVLVQTGWEAEEIVLTATAAGADGKAAPVVLAPATLTVSVKQEVVRESRVLLEEREVVAAATTGVVV